MTFKNYVSVFCDNERIVDNYGGDGAHPVYDAVYGVAFDDEITNLNDVSVRVKSCDSRIFYIFSNQIVQNLTCAVKGGDQYFKFTATKNLEVIFYEYKYPISVHTLRKSRLDYYTIHTSTGNICRAKSKFPYLYCVETNGLCELVSVLV